MKNLVVSLKGTASGMYEKYGCFTLVIPAGVQSGHIKIASDTSITDDDKKTHIYYDEGIYCVYSGTTQEVPSGHTIDSSVAFTNNTNTDKRVWFDNMYSAFIISVDETVELLMHDKISRLKYMPYLKELILKGQKGINIADFTNDIQPTSISIVNGEIYGELPSLNYSLLNKLQIQNNKGNFRINMSSLSKLTSLTTLNIFDNENNDVNVVGNIEVLKNLTKLKICNLYANSVIGDITTAFGKCIEMTKLFIRNSNASGTLEELMQAQIAAGRSSGVLDVSGASTNITVGGVLTTGHKYIHFDTQEITSNP